MTRSLFDYARYARTWPQAIGNKPLRTITSTDIERYMARRIGEVPRRPPTASCPSSAGCSTWRSATSGWSPTLSKGVKFYRENNQRVRSLSNEEELALAAEMGDEWTTLLDGANFAKHVFVPAVKRGKLENLH